MVFSASLSLILGGLTAQPFDAGFQEGSSNWVDDCCQRPVTCGCGDFFARIDYLYWRPCAEGINFGTMRNSTLTTSDFSVIEHRRDASFDGDSGFRVGAGYRNSDCCWDLALNYTYFHPSRHNNRHDNESGNVFNTDDLTIFPNLAITTTSANASYRLELDYLDLELGRELNWGKCLAFRPHIGLRFEHIEQKLRSNSDGTIVATGLVPTFNLSAKEKARFWGIGPRAGLDACWSLGCGWGIYGGAAASILYGKDKDRFNTFFQDTLARTASFSSKHSHKCSRAVSDVELGVYYKHSFCDDQYPLIAKLGWEQHMFFNQANFFNGSSGNNLSVQGLVLSAVVGF